MKKIFFVIILILAVSFSALVDAAVNKDVAAVDEWAAVAQNTVREGAEIDISTFYAMSLHIDMAVTSTTAHTGTKIAIQVSSNSSGDEDWTTLTEFSGPEGTANPEALGGAESATATVLEVASTVGLYDDEETRWIFILDDTVADSEICQLNSHVANTSVTVNDGITNAHDASDTLYDIAKNWVVSISPEFSRVRIVYDNTLDSDGSQIHCKTRISYMDGI